GRLRVGHDVPLVEADPRWAPLPRALRVRPGPGVLARARDPGPPGPPARPPAALPGSGPRRRGPEPRQGAEPTPALRLPHPREAHRALPDHEPGGGAGPGADAPSRRSGRGRILRGRPAALAGAPVPGERARRPAGRRPRPQLRAGRGAAAPAWRGVERPR